ncbi:CGNR zinc finger domain-containing protein [Streptomyces sp. NPDC051310]|uniref:CGNR zinc finger domain-containing protein n=1 Tax=Streptomyces sp. NPDC051310 TaxID=3365649 RepID=UPI00379887A9
MTRGGDERVRWFDPGRLCLDLMAARPADAARLAQWLLAVGLVPPGTPLGGDGVPEEWVARFGELGRSVDRLMREVLDGSPARGDDLDRLNAVAAAPPPAPRAVPGEGGGLVRAWGSPPGCAALLAAVARDAVELLTDPSARALLRQCEGAGCRRVYLDTSRGRRRRWCSSAVCGNRQRVARHRVKKNLNAR